MTNRWRRRGSRRRSARAQEQSSSSVRRARRLSGRGVRSRSADLLDAVLAGDRLVVTELELRRALQPQPRCRSAGAGTASRARAPAPLSCARLVVAERGVEHARQLQVGADLHAGQGDEADARDRAPRARAAAPARRGSDRRRGRDGSLGPSGIRNQELGFASHGFGTSRISCHPMRLRGDRDPLHREHLDQVADLDVVELVEADAALEAGLDFADIVLEAAQRADLAFVDDDVVAQQARLGVAGRA